MNFQGCVHSSRTSLASWGRCVNSNAMLMSAPAPPCLNRPYRWLMACRDAWKGMAWLANPKFVLSWEVVRPDRATHRALARLVHAERRWPGERVPAVDRAKR